MIANEILELVHGPEKAGERLNELVDQFRQGRDPEELTTLLWSHDDEVVSIAAWILSELPEVLYNNARIVSQLRALTEHAKAPIRFHAFSALYPLLGATDPATKALLTRMLSDPNDGVRKIAEAAAGRLGV